jgi:hypothetical protein
MVSNSMALEEAILPLADWQQAFLTQWTPHLEERDFLTQWTPHLEEREHEKYERLRSVLRCTPSLTLTTLEIFIKNRSKHGRQFSVGECLAIAETYKRVQAAAELGLI